MSEFTPKQIEDWHAVLQAIEKELRAVYSQMVLHGWDSDRMIQAIQLVEQSQDQLVSYLNKNRPAAISESSHKPKPVGEIARPKGAVR